MYMEFAKDYCLHDVIPSYLLSKPSDTIVTVFRINFCAISRNIRALALIAHKDTGNHAVLFSNPLQADFTKRQSNNLIKHVEVACL